jgi:hypothetical protein
MTMQALSEGARLLLNNLSERLRDRMATNLGDELADVLAALAVGPLPAGTAGRGAKAGGDGVAVAEYGDGTVFKTVLTLTAVDVAIAQVDTNKAAGGLKIYDWPAGAIKILGATVNLALTTNLGATADVVGGLGTAVSENDGDLGDTGEGDIVASTALVFSASAVAFKAQSTATEETTKDGTATAKDLFLNFADAHDTGGTGKKITATGTITIVWTNLGDY